MLCRAVQVLVIVALINFDLSSCIKMGRISDDDKKATAEVQSLISQVKLQVEGQLNGIFDTFEAVTYKTQTVAGRNYFVKAIMFSFAF